MSHYSTTLGVFAILFALLPAALVLGVLGRKLPKSALVHAGVLAGPGLIALGFLAAYLREMAHGGKCGIYELMAWMFAALAVAAGSTTGVVHVGAVVWRRVVHPRPPAGVR